MPRTCRFGCKRRSDASECGFVFYARKPRERSLWENGQ